MDSHHSLYMSKQQIKAEIGVRWVYRWLFLSVFFTVPWMAINLYNLSSRDPMSASILGVLAPALLHLLLLTALDKRNVYIRRHAQQAILIMMLRVASAVFFMGMMRPAETCGYVAINGFLWIAGYVWGRDQVKRGDCWLMRIRGETEGLPRPWAIEAPKEKVIAKVQQSLEDAETSFDVAISLINLGLEDDAIPHLTTAFRKGSADLRPKVVAELRKIDQVEIF